MEDMKLSTYLKNYLWGLGHIKRSLGRLGWVDKLKYMRDIGFPMYIFKFKRNY